MPVPFYIAQLRRGLEQHRTSIIPLPGEPIYTTDTRTLYIGDGVTPGGLPLKSEPVGYSLEFNTFNIMIDDTENTDLSIGSWNNVVNIISFGPDSDNSIWFNFSVPSFWRTNNDVKLSFQYTLDTASYAKSIKLGFKYYLIRLMQPVDYNNPNGNYSYSFLSSTSNVNLYSESDTAGQFKILGSHVTDPNTILISCKFTRYGSDPADTYPGKLFLSRIILSQD